MSGQHAKTIAVLQANVDSLKNDLKWAQGNIVEYEAKLAKSRERIVEITNQIEDFTGAISALLGEAE